MTDLQAPLHFKSPYSEGEIVPEATCKSYLQVRSEGDWQVRRFVKFYNLDAILAVGYRVRSPRGTQFRRWATERLREYLVKVFTPDDERMKNRLSPVRPCLTASTSCWNVSATSGPASGGCTCGCGRFSRWRPTTLSLAAGNHPVLTVHPEQAALRRHRQDRRRTDCRAR